MRDLDLECLDLFCGEGGAGVGYARAGFRVTGVDRSKARLERYPYEAHLEDALEYALEHGHRFHLIHASPTCTGYSRGTAAVPDRLERYDRLIPVVREVLEEVGRPYIIENVADARRELRSPLLLCGRMFGLESVDEDGTRLVLDRHRLFEHSSHLAFMAPEHLPHDMSLQVAGSYGGGRRDRHEARYVRKGGYVPRSADVQRSLVGVPWMSEVGCRLSVPPVYTEFLGRQAYDQLATAAV